MRLYRKIVMMMAMMLIAVGASAADQKPAEKKAAEVKPADKPQQKPQSPNDVLKQKDFAAMLVKAMRWQEGVPKTPADKDYLLVLDGRRTFHFEAEDHYARKGDNVSVKEHLVNGPFSGKGWVSGVSKATKAHFTVFLPLEGNYTLSVASKGDNQVWSAKGSTFKVSSGNRFREVVAGTVHLKAGEQEIVAEIPPEGAVDYLVLDAVPLNPIEPLEGWRPDETLTLGTVAEIGASLLGWERGLQEDKEWKPVTISAATAAAVPETANKTQIPYLGKFVSKEWVRAGRLGAELQIPLILESTGAYDVKVRYLGEKLIAHLDGRRIEKSGKPYLDMIDLGLTRLRRGAHTLILRLQPMGGVDAVTLEKRKSSPEDYLKLIGIEGKPSDVVTRGQADKYLTSFAERFKERI